MLTFLFPRPNNSLLPKGIAPTTRQAEYYPPSTTTNNLSKADTFERTKAIQPTPASTASPTKLRNGVRLTYEIPFEEWRNHASYQNYVNEAIADTAKNLVDIANIALANTKFVTTLTDGVEQTKEVTRKPTTEANLFIRFLDVLVTENPTKAPKELISTFFGKRGNSPNAVQLVNALFESKEFPHASWQEMFSKKLTAYLAEHFSSAQTTSINPSAYVQSFDTSFMDSLAFRGLENTLDAKLMVLFNRIPSDIAEINPAYFQSKLLPNGFFVELHQADQLILPENVQIRTDYKTPAGRDKNQIAILPLCPPFPSLEVESLTEFRKGLEKILHEIAISSLPVAIKTNNKSSEDIPLSEIPVSIFSSLCPTLNNYISQLLDTENVAKVEKITVILPSNS